MCQNVGRKSPLYFECVTGRMADTCRVCPAGLALTHEGCVNFGTVL